MPAADIKKLMDGGIHTLEALAHAAKRELTAIKGLSEAKVEKLQKEGEQPQQQGSPAAPLSKTYALVKLLRCPT